MSRVVKTWKEAIGALAEAEMELRTIGSDIELPGHVRFRALRLANNLLPALPPYGPRFQPPEPPGPPGRSPRRSWLILHGWPCRGPRPSKSATVRAAPNVLLGWGTNPARDPEAAP